MKLFIDEVIDWNKKRYKQKFNFELSKNLLKEELLELLVAESLVDKLDALGDITFVSVGILWKLEIPNRLIRNLFMDNNFGTISSQEIVKYLKKSLINHVEKQYPPNKSDILEVITLMLFILFDVVLPIIQHLKLNEHFHEIVFIICKSNNTKTEEKINVIDKYSGTGKGPNYISPKLKLLEFIAERGLYD